MTVTFNGANLYTPGPFTEMLYVEDGCKYDVTVKVVGNNTFNCEGPCFFAPKLVIQGTPGCSLTMTSKNNYAMNINNGDLIILDMPEMNITGDNGAINGNDGGNLNIFNSTLTIKDTDTFSPAAIKGFKAMNLNGCGFLSPAGGSFKNGRVYDKEGNLYKGVVKIGPAVKYGLTIAGVEVTSDNCTDVLGDGTVSVVATEASGMIITLDGANITYDGYAITTDPLANINYINIYTDGASSITSTASSAIYVPDMPKFTTMTIRGVLDIKAEEYGVYLGTGELYLDECESITITSGKACLYSADFAEVWFKNVTEVTLNPTDEESSAIEGFGAIKFGEGIDFMTSDLTYDDDMKALVRYNAKYTDKVVIGEIPVFSCLKIKGNPVRISDADDVLGDGTMKIVTDEEKGEFTLVMNNCNLDAEYNGITFSSDSKLCNSARIVAENSSITANWYDIISEVPLTINGSLALSVKESKGTAIIAYQLTIDDANVDVTIHDETAFDGFGGPLTIKDSYVHIQGSPICRPITDFVDLVLDGVDIIKPAGATYVPGEGLDVSKVAGFDGEVIIGVKLDILAEIVGSYGCTLPDGDEPTLKITANGSIRSVIGEDVCKFDYATDVANCIKTPYGYMLSLNSGKAAQELAIVMNGKNVEAILVDGKTPLYPVAGEEDPAKACLSMETLKYKGAALTNFADKDMAILISEDETGNAHINLYGDEKSTFSQFDFSAIEKGKKVNLHVHGNVCINADDNKNAIMTSAKLKELIIDVPTKGDCLTITGGNGGDSGIFADDTNLTIMGSGSVVVNTQADYAISCYNTVAIKGSATVDLTATKGALDGVAVEEIAVAGLYEWNVESKQHISLIHIPSTDCIAAGEGSVLIDIDPVDNIYKEWNSSFYEPDKEETILVAAVAHQGYIFKGWSDGVKDAFRSVTLTPGAGKPAIKALYEKTEAKGEKPELNWLISAHPSEGGQVSYRTELGKVYPLYSWYPYGTKFIAEAQSNDGYTFTTWSNLDTNAQTTFTLVEEGMPQTTAYFIANNMKNVMAKFAGTYYGYLEDVEYENEEDKEGTLVTENIVLTIGNDGKGVYSVVCEKPAHNSTTTFDLSNVASIEEANFGYQMTILTAPDESKQISFVYVKDNKLEACVMNDIILFPNKDMRADSYYLEYTLVAGMSNNYIHVWDFDDNCYEWYFDFDMENELADCSWMYGNNFHLCFVGNNTITPKYDLIEQPAAMYFSKEMKNLHIELPGYDDSLVIKGDFTKYGISAEKTNLFFHGNGNLEIVNPSAEAAIYTYKNMTIEDEMVMTLTAKSAFGGIDYDEMEILRKPAEWIYTEESGYETYTLVREDREDAITAATQAADSMSGVRKFMKDGKIVILRDGKLYNISGVQVK